MSLILLTCLPAAAQYRPERPYRGIFASGIDTVGQSITAQGTLSGGYDDDVLAGFNGSNTPRSQQSGSLAQFSGGVNYLLNVPRVSVTAGAGSTFRYYPELTGDVFDTHNARVGGVVSILQRQSLTVHGAVSYVPYTFYSAFPEPDLPVEPAAPPEPDFIPVATQYVTYTSGAIFSQRLNRRVTLNSNYTYYQANRLGRDFWRQGAGGNLGYNLTRNLVLRLGYYYNEGHYDGHVSRSHRPVLTIDFNRALSLTRNTTVGFSAGTLTTVVEGEVQTRLRTVGDARITHEIGRSWTLTGIYSRGVYYVETLPEPVFADSVRASLVGLLTRRLQFRASTSASFGDSGFSNSRPYNIYQASAGLSSALTRFMNVGVTYSAFRYDFHDDIILDPGVPHHVDRRSILGHITLWAPILNRTRRADAAR